MHNLLRCIHVPSQELQRCPMSCSAWNDLVHLLLAPVYCIPGIVQQHLGTGPHQDDSC